ncbi:MAG: WG repeat-containing protein [Deltaproteobacteria bacterium]|nr:WG repeat-containing protein [Deltaproteobacteria bacterium]
MKLSFDFLVFFTALFLPLSIFAADNHTKPKLLYPYIENGSVGYFDEKLAVIIKPNFVDGLPQSEGMAAVCVNDLWGYIDSNGHIVIKPNFTQVQSFLSGFAAVQKDGKWGLINRKGKFTAEPKWDELRPVHEGLAPARRAAKWGYIDVQGREIIPLQFDDAHPFIEGLAKVKQGEKWGFVAHNGQLLNGFRYDDAWFFSEGLAAIAIGDTWGYIDTKGQEVVARRYTKAFPFHNRRAAVYIASHLVFIDKHGGGVDFSHPGYYNPRPFIDGYAARMDTRIGKLSWYYLNTFGLSFLGTGFNTKYPLDSTFTHNFSEDLCGVEIGGLCGFMDRSGKFVVRPAYSKARAFSEGLAVVQWRDKWGYINKQGMVVIPIRYNYAFSSFKKGRAEVMENGKHFILDTSGNIVDPSSIVYNHKAPKPDLSGLHPIRRNKRWGFANAADKIVIAPRYARVEPFKDGIAKVTMADSPRWGLINTKGELLYSTYMSR